MKNIKLYTLLLTGIIGAFLIFSFFLGIYYIFSAPSYSINGGELKTEIGFSKLYENSSSSIMYAPWNTTGFLTYGPYIPLGKGKYEVEFLIKVSNFSSNQDVGKIDIYSQGRILSEKILDSTTIPNRGKDTKIKLPLIIDKGEDPIEFRTFKNQFSEMEVKSITVILADSFAFSSAIIQKIFILVFLSLFLTYLLKRYQTKSFTFIKMIKPKGILPQQMLFIFIFCFYLLVICGMFHPLPVISGDEKHYLVATHSIINDFDIDLKNNYENKDYLVFHRWLVNDPHVSVTKNGKWYPTHGLFLSILLIPAYIMGGLFGVQVFIALITTLVLVLTYSLVKDLTQNEYFSIIVVLVMAFTGPILFYSYSIYPEVIAALILIYCTRTLLHIHTNQPYFKSEMIICGLLLSVTPFLGIKYLAFAIPLLLLLIIYCKNPKEKILAFFPFIISIILYLSYLAYNYGSLSLIKQYTGVSSKIVMQSGFSEGYSGIFHLENLFNIPHLLSFLLSQEVGLLLYSPIYLICFFGLIVLLKKYLKQLNFLIIIFLPSIIYLIMYLSSIAYGGWSPPPRPLITIMPIIGVLFSYGLIQLYRHKLYFSLIFLSVISVYYSFTMLVNPNLIININGGNKLLADFLGVTVEVQKTIFPSIYLQNYFFIILAVIYLLFIIYPLFIEYCYNQMKNFKSN